MHHSKQDGRAQQPYWDPFWTDAGTPVGDLSANANDYQAFQPADRID